MTPPRRRPPPERRWPWFQQIVDAAFAAVGFAAAAKMSWENTYSILGIVFVAACAGWVSASQLIRVLLGRWDAKP